MPYLYTFIFNAITYATDMTEYKDSVQEEIIADFEMFDDPDDKLQYLIDMADLCVEINPQHKTEQYLIDGCQSRVWIDAEMREDGKVYFSARRRIAPGSIVSVKIEDVLDCDLCGRALLFPEA